MHIAFFLIFFFSPFSLSFGCAYAPVFCSLLVRSFVAGTVLTFNPIGGIIGGFIGAGAGAGVNEVNKEIALKRTKADHAFAHLKSFQVRLRGDEK